MAYKSGGTKVEPEWVDCEGLRDMFGIKRSLAYVLIHDGLVESVALKYPSRKDSDRGKRLFKVSSVREYLNSLKNE